jgi:hypothetical protein
MLIPEGEREEKRGYRKQKRRVFGGERRIDAGARRRQGEQRLEGHFIGTSFQTPDQTFSYQMQTAFSPITALLQDAQGGHGRHLPF